MGCVPSKEVGNGEQQRGNARRKVNQNRGNNQNKNDKAANHANSGNNPKKESKPPATKEPSRTNSAVGRRRSLRNNKESASGGSSGETDKPNTPQNGVANRPGNHSDPHWKHIWETQRDYLLDPADVHSAMADVMARVTDKLSATEMLFLQRRVRHVVRVLSTNTREGSKMMGRILANQNNSQETEGRAIIERCHLLSEFVIRKILPTCTPINDTDPIESIYILALYLNESYWDRVFEIAVETAKAADLDMDVNSTNNGAFKVTPPIPGPLDEVPVVRQGVSMSSLSFLMALALRGDRNQRLQLLFYMLLPPRTLESFLQTHPAGGVPCWLLEVGNDIVFSLASMSHYHIYGDTYTPQSPSKKNAKNSSQSNGSAVSIPSGKNALAVDGTDIKELLSLLLAPPLKGQDNATSNENKVASPMRKTSSLGIMRRGSNHSAVVNEEDLEDAKAQKSEMMEKLQSIASEGKESYDNPDLSRSRQQLEKSELPQTLTLAVFHKWAQDVLDDVALDRIMNRLFTVGILPSAHLESELVLNQWKEWQQHEHAIWSKAQPEGTFEYLTKSLQKFLLLENGDSSAEETKKPIRKPFGGIGGFDGRGGMGHGVLYCIDKKWWDSWEAYVGWTWAEDKPKNGHTTRQRPGALSTESLLERVDEDVVPGILGSYEIMKSGLVLNEDYVLVPPGVWDTLYEAYGGGPPLPRMVLPPQSSLSDIVSTENSRDSEIEVKANEGETTDIVSPNRVMRIPKFIRVETHPWILHLHLCDPQQPYRRGDAGPMSIRVMTMPEQPLWRLYAEIVVRLPFNVLRSYNTEGRGRARLWKRIEPAGPRDSLSRYGPWTLLCKNKHATLPIVDLETELQNHYDELREDWQKFVDNASVESIGLSDGDHLMVECAVLNRDGGFTWPREAAARAGRTRRQEENEKKFRRTLQGVDDNGNPLENPPKLEGMSLEATDSSGRWFMVKILDVRMAATETDEEDIDEESVEMESAEGFGGDSGPPPNAYGNGRKEGGDEEHKQVLVDFRPHGGHTEWISIDSNRLSAPSERTVDAEESPVVTNKTVPNGTAANGKATAQVKKAVQTESLEANGKVCTFPGYGACGLANLGNTCYVNSAVQCVSYMPLLRAYLLCFQYKAFGDLNKDNPLGTGGKLFEEFADLLRDMWSAKIGEKHPKNFRLQLSKARPQFAGTDQQDAQEFLNYMLDVLHEDSNKVRKKPAVAGPEDEWVNRNSLPRVGEETWRRFLRRNRSVMTDVAMGQVLNTVTCPVCHFSSRNFDPFNLLSIPFPTVADVIFQCTVVRRATALNTPWVLNKSRKGDRIRDRFKRNLVDNPQPPNEEYIVEQYVIALSRLADGGDLKLQIQNLCGVPSKQLKLCRVEEVSLNDKDDQSVVKRQMKITPLQDKDGSCGQFAKQRTTGDDVGSSPSAPVQIVAFESTLRQRPLPESADEEEEEWSESTTEGEESDDKEYEFGVNKKEFRELNKLIGVYGNDEECRVHDTDTLLIAKAISRSLWPRAENELKLGLRVDAIDHRNNWFPGSVIEIVGPTKAADGSNAENDSSKTQVRVHFDNFSSKWDEMYTIDQFTEGRVRPLYSHAEPRNKPTEFIVHHRYTNRDTRLSNLFGQSFYMQCHNEWTTARAGAQILAQASRFLRQSMEQQNNTPADADTLDREAKVQRLYDRTQAVISEFIDVLIDADREFVQQALGIPMDAKADTTVENFRNPSFDASPLSTALVRRLNGLLHRLPFEVRVCSVDSPIGGTNEEVIFPFSLMRTIGNYMNPRHAIVLQWREPPTDKKAPSGKPSSYLNAPVMYVAPIMAVDKISAEILNNANQKSKRSANSMGSGGLQLGVCLTEFCKVQQLSISDNWRCPRCKVFREGKQNLNLWRLPDLLTFHIKRFNCSARWREKITTKVNFPLTGLDMTEWCHAESPVVTKDSKDSHVYDLIGVLNHYGSMTGGHYVATCKATACGRGGSEEVAHDFNGVGIGRPVSPDDEGDAQSGWRLGRQKTEVNHNKVAAAGTAKAAADSAEPLWLQFDDDLVEPIPPRHVVSEMAYVLFYRRRRLTPANIARYSTLE